MEDPEEQNEGIREFLSRDFGWEFSAGECNFLIQLLAYVVSGNPHFVPAGKGNKEPLNYQSIRSIVLLNEKLSTQLQEKAAEASVIIDQVHPASDKVQ